MLDLSHIPKPSRADIQVFNANSTIVNTHFSAWVKPRGCTFVRLFGLGAGGGGGAGAVPGTTSAGGGGGASGSQFNVIVPAYCLPDTLYISVGYGGAGGVAAAGGTGIGTAVYITPQSAFTNAAIISATGGVGGGLASVGTAGSAGTAGATATISSTLGGFCFFGGGLSSIIAWSIAGQPGTAGGTTAGSVAITLPLTGLVVTGGTGGAGVSATAATSTSSGQINGAGLYFPINPASNLPVFNVQDGSHGFKIPGLTYYVGGTGGGAYSGTTVVGGGIGGNGAIGCGGGGGGGTFTGGGVQSTGGRGGDGICIITSW